MLSSTPIFPSGDSVHGHFIWLFLVRSGWHPTLVCPSEITLNCEGRARCHPRRKPISDQMKRPFALIRGKILTMNSIGLKLHLCALCNPFAHVAVKNIKESGRSANRQCAPVRAQESETSSQESEVESQEITLILTR